MRAGGKERWTVVALAVSAVLLRLAYLTAPAGSDESGYLTIARQWHGAGSSLYGRYWVDRPPLLITLFQLGGAVGGLPGVRVLAAIAAGVTVLGVAAAVRTAVGPRAALLTAGIAAVLLASPQLGAVQINGELLAAPFVAWSMALTLDAVQSTDDSHAGRAAFGAGLLALAALMVKQNMGEPAIFGAAFTVVAWRTGKIPTVRLVRIATRFGAGAVLMLVMTCAWTAAHGTSLTGVFDAVYPFRIRAAHLIATFPDAELNLRAGRLLWAVLGSGILLAPTLLIWAALRRRVSAPVLWGLALTILWTTLSIVSGGGYWDHYLVEAIVPAAISTGIALGHPSGARRTLTAWLPALATGMIVAIALVQWGHGMAGTRSTPGAGIGRAIAEVAQPGDTLTNMFGNAEMMAVAGMASPYPYLWTLPAQVEDPKLHQFTALLKREDAPTWVVNWGRSSFPRSVTEDALATLESRYHRVGFICGRTVYLRVGVVRPSPPANESCRANNSLGGGP